MHHMLQIMIAVTAILLINTHANSQCPNDFCEEAIVIGCTPYAFDNYGCSDEEFCIQPNQPTGSNCVLYIEDNSTWFTFEVTQEGYYFFNLSTNYTSTQVPAYNYCYGADFLEGSHWALATGECGDLEWLSTWINPANCNRCRCFGGQFNSVTWVGDCDEIAPCDNPIPMQPFWNGNCPLMLEPPLPYVYDVCVQEWELLFYLPVGTYYFVVYGFIESLGDGVISICPETPLCPKPVATLEGVNLSWTESGESGYKVFHVTDLVAWNPVLIWEGNETEIAIEESEYYYVSSQCGNSNLVYANIQPVTPTNSFDDNFFNVKGQQYVKKGVIIKQQ